MGIVPFQTGGGRGWGYVRFGSEADMCSAQAHVRFGPKADVGTTVGVALELTPPTKQSPNRSDVRDF
jgi:hypothetical protein